MADSATDLHDLLDAVLSASAAALDTIPGFAPGLEGAPGRAYITDGQPSHYCCEDGQLTVNASSIREGQTQPLGLAAGTRHRLGFRLNHVGIQVWITRCRPQDTPPVPATMTAHAEQHNADGWALWNYMWNINRPGSADPIVSLCDEWFMDSMIPIQPSGQCSGWTLSVRAQLAGYGDGTDP
jgi:hypothetical protein